MKFIVWIISSINLYIGLHYFLNVLQLLQTSKYSKTATAVFAILFLVMGIAGFYFSFIKNNYSPALLIGIGPWTIALVILLFNMMAGDYK